MRTRAGFALVVLLLAACGRASPALQAADSSPAWISTAAQGPTPTPLIQPSLEPPLPTPTFALAPGDRSRGPDGAAAVLVVYTDFQSPACAELWSVLTALEARHPGELRWVYRPFPLIAIHDKSSLAAEAAQAAADQGRFWVMHDTLFERWMEWIELSPDLFSAWLIRTAQEIGLDVPAFQGALQDGRHRELARQAFDQGLADGIPAAPVVYLNGNLFQPGLTLLNLEAAIRLELLAARRFRAYPPMELDPGVNYFIRIQMDIGDVVIELFQDRAPWAVNSFLFLARQGWMDRTPVQRVIPGVLVEMGDPSGTGLGEPGYAFGTEIDPQARFDQAGVVAMSSSAPGVCGSRFFISLGPLPHLDGTRTVFGRVLEGLSLLQTLEARDPLSDLLDPPPATVIRVTVEER
jgi:cyclophilin family peptidyl-prolyl cis-trans isomerase/protein-disulfide isomerase